MAKLPRRCSNRMLAKGLYRGCNFANRWPLRGEVAPRPLGGEAAWDNEGPTRNRCPSAEQFQDWLADRLTGAEADAIAAYVGCPLPPDAAQVPPLRAGVDQVCRSFFSFRFAPRGR